MAKKLICRTCLKKEDPNFCRNITPESDNELTANILEMLSFCVPEIDIHLLTNPVICNTCISLLETSYKFKNQCLKSEEKILQYSQLVNFKVDLNSLQSGVKLSKNKKLTVNNNKETVKVVIESVETSTNKKGNTRKQPESNDIYHDNSRNTGLNCDNCYGCTQNCKDPAYHKKVYIAPFICYNCDKSLEDIQRFRKHINIHRRSRQCRVCQKSFRDLHNLSTHLRTHTGAKPFTCNICSKSFQQQYSLKQHLRQHVGHSAVKCNYCEKVFSTKYNVKIHVQNTHRKKPTCELCGKTFNTKTALIKHLEDDEPCFGVVKSEPVEVEPVVKIEPEFIYLNELPNQCKEEYVIMKEEKPYKFEEVRTMN